MLYPPPSKKNLSHLSFIAHYKMATWPSNLAIGERLTIFTFLDYSGGILILIFPITPWAKNLQTCSDLPLVLNDDWTTELVCILEGHKSWTNKIGSLGNVRSCHHIWGIYNMSPFWRLTVKWGMPCDDNLDWISETKCSVWKTKMFDFKLNTSIKSFWSIWWSCLIEGWALLDLGKF